MNETTSANRIHIGFFGRRNAGKSSLVNSLTGQPMSIVSDQKGTTTDPVKKSMELLPLGPVVITDTPGYDDEGSLGELRIDRTRDICRSTNIAVLVVDCTMPVSNTEDELIALFNQYNIPYIIACNKSDLLPESGLSGADYSLKALLSHNPDNTIPVSTKEHLGIEELKEMLGRFTPDISHRDSIVGDLVHPGDTVILVTPIDESAPKGRIILPQQLVLRELLDRNVIALVTNENTLSETMSVLRNNPSLVITDSQVFNKVSHEIPEDIPLTSFSILLSRYKGYLSYSMESIKAISNLRDGARVLIAEGCTHHRQCKDIGTVKIPNWLSQYTNTQFTFETCSGNDFPDTLKGYDLVIHCGACMLNEKEVTYRLNLARSEGVPFINYGIAIAQMNGILSRCTGMFPQI